MYNYEALSDEDRAQMLEIIGVKSVEELYCSIPEDARMNSLDLSDGADEIKAQKNLEKIAKMNKTDYLCFMGSGAKRRFIPPVLADLASRFEFLSCYTPYQAEISQGSLRAMYEFQSVICNLVNQDVSNASVYDGASACAEAILMAVRIAKKNRVLVSEKLNPEYLKVVKTYTWANGIEVEYFNEIPQNTADYAAVLIQTPDYYGEIAEVSDVDCLLIVCCDISTLSILKPPCEYGADIVAADIQTLGMPMSFGGPHAGILACKEKYMRQLPGRLAGRTVDKDGNQAFTLTIQTREQHIKREKATSNICSNQALMGLWATLYLSLLEKGFRQAGYLSAKNAHNLSAKLSQKQFLRAFFYIDLSPLFLLTNKNILFFQKCFF